MVVELPRGKKGVVKNTPGRPPKHGGYSGFDMMAVAREKEEEIRATLAMAKIELGQQDAMVVSTLAQVLAKIEMLDRWFAVVGLIERVQLYEDRPAVVQVQSAMKIYLAAVNSAARLYDQLGLTPQSRNRLGLQIVKPKQDMASSMAEAREEEGA
jgi:hypothetical protein